MDILRQRFARPCCTHAWPQSRAHRCTVVTSIALPTIPKRTVTFFDSDPMEWELPNSPRADCDLQKGLTSSPTGAEEQFHYYVNDHCRMSHMEPGFRASYRVSRKEQGRDGLFFNSPTQVLVGLRWSKVALVLEKGTNSGSRRSMFRTSRLQASGLGGNHDQKESILYCNWILSLRCCTEPAASELNVIEHSHVQSTV